MLLILVSVVRCISFLPQFVRCQLVDYCVIEVTLFVCHSHDTTTAILFYQHHIEGKMRPNSLQIISKLNCRLDKMIFVVNQQKLYSLSEDCSLQSGRLRCCIENNDAARSAMLSQATQTFFSLTHTFCCGPGSSVGIATGYGLDGPGIKSRWGSRFSAPVQTAPGAHPASCTMGTWSFLGGKKRPGA